MRGESLLVVFERHHFDGADLNHAGVVDQHVNPIEMLLDDFDQLFDLRPVGHVARKGEDVRAASREVCACALKLRIVTRADGDARALGGELAREHESESARASRD